jgi:FlaA1/EpsC-like NDP-sugar epimerase
MTRFMTSLEDAAILVLYAFTHGKNSAFFVQKALPLPRGTLAKA